MPDATAAKIRALNDHARQSMTGCRVVFTQGIAALDEQVISAIVAQVRRFDQFTPDNDPYGEHDFGAFHHGDVQVFWKWDYFDLDFSMHSPDPADDAITARVLTIMLADEY